MPPNFDAGMRSACERVAAVLPGSAPALWASLRAPADESAIDSLRSALLPFVLPAEVETWLRFANGQGRRGAPWWPTVNAGWLLSAEEMREVYLGDRSAGDLPAGLLAITYGERFQSSIELVHARQRAIIDTMVEAGPGAAIAPSFVAMISAIIDLCDRQLLSAPYPLMAAESEFPEHRREDVRVTLELAYEQFGWEAVPEYVRRGVAYGQWPTDWVRP